MRIRWLLGSLQVFDANTHAGTMSRFANRINFRVHTERFGSLLSLSKWE